jgi:hypothetical protein
VTGDMLTIDIADLGDCKLQRLRPAYRDGQLEAVNEAWMGNPDFGIEE